MYTVHIVSILLVALLCFVYEGAAIKCSICDTTDEGSTCISNPPHAKECPGFDYCINVAKYTLSGTLKTFTRSCSPFALPSACLPGKDKASGNPVQLCYSTCDKDGCNSNRSLHQILDLLRRKRRK